MDPHGMKGLSWGTETGNPNNKVPGSLYSSDSFHDVL